MGKQLIDERFLWRANECQLKPKDQQECQVGIAKEQFRAERLTGDEVRLMFSLLYSVPPRNGSKVRE